MTPALASATPPGAAAATGTLARDTAARLGPILDEVRVEVDAVPDTPAAGELSLAADGASAPERITAGLELVRARTGVTDRRVRAAYLHGWYTWFVLAPIVMAYQGQRRVPSLSGPEVRLTWDGIGEPTLFLGRRVAVLADDALAADPDADILVDAAALRERLHDEIVAHMSLVIALLREHTHLGSRMQWLQTADVLAGLLQYAGERCGDERAGIAEAEALLASPDSPLRSTRGRFVAWHGAGIERTLFHRASCCLWYRSPGASYCMTCPLIDPEAQETGVQAWLATPT